jgi:hypothetical protein
MKRKCKQAADLGLRRCATLGNIPIVTYLIEDDMWKLTPYELELTRAKIDKINARAAKRGFTGRFDLTATRMERSERVGGFDVTEILYETSITGEPPSYGGWTLVAALDFDDQAGLIVHTAPGVDTVDRTQIKEGHCTHCQQRRRRTRSYLVQSDTGQTLQVGSTCIKDFLGWSGNVVFLSDSDVSADLESCIGGEGWRYYSTESVLAVAWAVITKHGFVRTSDYYSMPTRDRVSFVLWPPSKLSNDDRAVLAEYKDLVPQAADMAAKVRAFILSDAFAGDNEYVLNLKALCRADMVSGQYLGMVASAPQAWARHNEQTLIKERDHIVNEYVGGVKDKLTLKVKIKAVRFIPSDYGSTTLYTLMDDTGHMFKWFASRDALGGDVTDTFQTITGTVKAHEEYQGQKSTVLTRVKVV